MDIKALVGSLRSAADELERIQGGLDMLQGTAVRRGRRAGKRTMSAEARAKISAAAKKRWAKQKGKA